MDKELLRQLFEKHPLMETRYGLLACLYSQNSFFLWEVSS